MIKTGFIQEVHPITSLTTAFTVAKNGFRLFLNKKAEENADVAIVIGKTVGSSAEVSVPVTAGYWSDVLFSEIKATTGIDLTKYDAYFGTREKIRYRVMFDKNGGQFVEEDGDLIASFDHDIEWGGKATEPTTDPSMYDSTFLGWFIGDNEFDFNTVLYNDVTLTAHYATNLTVTFDSAGGSAVDHEQLLSGEAATEPTDPTKAGYTFDKWTLDGEEYNFATLVTEDITLVATWLENFTVSFDSDGGSAVASQEIADGSTATEPADPTKAGYTFDEWQLESEAFNFATPITEDIELTATWLENFTVTFDSQGGSAVTAQEVADGSAATEPDPDPTKDTFTFSHWSTTIDGEAFVFTTPITADITLYAVWTS